MVVFYLSIGLANLTKGPHGLLIPLLAVLVFLAASRDLVFVRRMGLAWGLPLALLPVALWVAAYRGTGEPFPLEALVLRLAHRFIRGEHHAQPFYHVLVSLPVEFFPWVVLLPHALWHTFPRSGARPDRETPTVTRGVSSSSPWLRLLSRKRAATFRPRRRSLHCRSGGHGVRGC